MKTIVSGMAAGDSPKKHFYVRVSTLEQGSRASARRQAKSAAAQLRRLKLPQWSEWSGGKKVEAPKDERIAFYSRTAMLEQGKKQAWKRQQVKTANDYLKHQGLPPLSRKDIYLDPCYSGMNLDRPALSKLIDHVKKGKIETLLVLSTDRLSRDIMGYFALTDMFNAHGVCLRSVDWQIDKSWATEKSDLSIMSKVFSDYYQAMLKKRQLAGIKRRKQWLAQHGNKRGKNG